MSPEPGGVPWAENLCAQGCSRGSPARGGGRGARRRGDGRKSEGRAGAPTWGGGEEAGKGRQVETEANGSDAASHPGNAKERPGQSPEELALLTS